MDRHEDTAARTRDEKLALVRRQYESVAGAINALFSALAGKVGGEDWREDGIGTCAASPSTFDNHMVGVADSAFPPLWDHLAEKARDSGKTLGGFNGHNACPYHVRGEGCVLGTLKPARCLSYVEQDDDALSAALGIGGDRLQDFLGGALRRAMMPEQASVRDDLAADRAIQSLRALTDRVLRL